MPNVANKFDEGKLRMDLIPPEAVTGLARALSHGAVVHGDRNWELGMDWSRPFASAQRHLWAFWGGDDWDESQFPKDRSIHHLECALAEIAFLLTYYMRDIGRDNRPNPTFMTCENMNF